MTVSNRPNAIAVTSAVHFLLLGAFLPNLYRLESVGTLVRLERSIPSFQHNLALSLEEVSFDIPDGQQTI